jgi:hypothetical protein
MPHQKTKPHYIEPIHNCHSLMFVLNCKLGNTVIVYGYKFKKLFNILCTARLDIPSCAAAFLVDLRGFFAAPLWQRQCCPANAQMKAGDVSSPTL